MDGQHTIGNAVPPAAVPVARPIFIPPRAESVPAHPMFLADSSRRDAVVDIGILLCVFVTTWVLAQSIWTAMELLGVAIDPRLLGIVLTLAGAAAWVGATVQIAKSQGNWKASLGLCYDCWWITGLCGIVALVTAYGTMLATVAGAVLFYPDGLEALRHNQEVIAENFPKLHPGLLCVLSLTVGFYEELIFRGFLLTRLRRATGSASIAVFASSVLFALPHAASQELITVIPLFVMGAGWAVITLWRKSIVPAILAHAAFDMFAFLHMYFFSSAWK